MKKDYKISIIRILAMLSIVACHIFQAQNMGIAFWLNVGVQVFLFMSGFLYGRKKIDDTWEWIKRQFSKILLPYYIYFIIILIIYIVFASSNLNIKNVVSLLLCFQLSSIPTGLNHFWFIPVILICYSITPFLQKILKEKDFFSINKVIFLFGIMFYIEALDFFTSIDDRIRNIICYIMGYLIAHLSLKNKKEMKNLSICIVFFAIIINFIKIFLIPTEYDGILISKVIEIILMNSHILLGTAIFIILYKVLDTIEKYIKPAIVKIINIVDKHCFYIYITHHVFILGPLAIINLTNNLSLNIVIIICCIAISSYALGKLTDLVRKRRNS